MPRQCAVLHHYIAKWYRWESSGHWPGSNNTILPTWFCQNQPYQSWVGGCQMFWPETENTLWTQIQSCIIIMSDASFFDWNAMCLGQTTEARWSQTEISQHIKVLEFRATYLSLNSFKGLWEGSRISLRQDNTSVVSQIVKMGSPQSKRCLVETK